MNKKEQICKAALKLFNMHGYDRTPTAMISKEAGVAIGTLFHYFSTKEELINSLYLICKESMVESTLAGIGEERTYRGKLRRAYTNFLRWSLENQDGFLFFQQYSNSPNILDSTRKAGRERFDSIVDLIRTGVEEEILKNVDVEFLMVTVMGMITANALFLFDKPELKDNDVFIEDSFGMMWDAIKK